MACVFLTGATGFVGGASAFELLRDPRVERLVVLCRAATTSEAEERVRRSLQRFGDLSPRWSAVEVVVGDLETPLERALLAEVTHVLHAAACTSLRSMREVRRTNVDGSIRLASRFERAPRLERFLHVSTAYRCGAVPLRVVEEDTPAASEHPSEYSRTKEAAERMLEAMALPLLIARPSAVVGHGVLGVKPSASLYWYYRALALAGVAPFPAARRRDIVPVDYVARALAHLLFVAAPRHACVHVSSGEAGANAWGEIRAALGGDGSGEVVAPEALAEHRAWSRAGLEGERARMALAAVARYSALPVEAFANARLLATGLPPPPPFASYARRCVASETRSLSGMVADDD